MAKHTDICDSCVLCAYTCIWSVNSSLPFVVTVIKIAFGGVLEGSHLTYKFFLCKKWQCTFPGVRQVCHYVDLWMIKLLRCEKASPPSPHVLKRVKPKFRTTQPRTIKSIQYDIYLQVDPKCKNEKILEMDKMFGRRGKEVKNVW